MSHSGHSHSHDHAHSHDHGHKHAHAGNHEHKHEAGNDQWVGADYLKQPGLRELAKVSHDSTLYALQSAGISSAHVKDLNLLEVGCGAGAVTQLYANTFASVHAIDVSPSMLSTFSTELPIDKFPDVTHSLHTLSSSSPEEFKAGSVKRPIEGDKEREVALPRSQWDVAASNLVLHHVDDIPGFMTGLVGLVVDGGWLVLTEFTNLNQGHKATKEGSVNAPHHYHHEFNVESITKLLNHFGLKDVHAEVKGTMRIWRDDKFHDVDCLIARGRKQSS